MSERSYRFDDGTEYRQTLLMERMMKALDITEDDLDDKTRGRKPSALKLQLLAAALYATGISKRRISRLMDATGPRCFMRCVRSRNVRPRSPGSSGNAVLGW